MMNGRVPDSFAWIGAAPKMKVEDLRPKGERWQAARDAQPSRAGRAIHAYIAAAGKGQEPRCEALFCASEAGTNSCICRLPTNPAIPDAGVHFRFGCYRTPVSSAAPVPVTVQFLAKGAPVFPTFAIQPGGEHVIVRPAALDEVYYEANQIRPGRWMRLKHGFWLEGAFHLLPAPLEAAP